MSTKLIWRLIRVSESRWLHDSFKEIRRQWLLYSYSQLVLGTRCNIRGYHRDSLDCGVYGYLSLRSFLQYPDYSGFFFFRCRIAFTLRNVRLSFLNDRPLSHPYLNLWISKTHVPVLFNKFTSPSQSNISIESKQVFPSFVFNSSLSSEFLRSQISPALKPKQISLSVLLFPYPAPFPDDLLFTFLNQISQCLAICNIC